MPRNRLCERIHASALLVKHILIALDKNTVIAVSMVLLFTAIISSSYNTGIYQVMAHSPNNIPEITMPADSQIFTFTAGQGLSAHFIVEAVDPDAEDLVDITNTPLPPGAFYESLETHEQPSTGSIVFDDGFPIPGTYTVTFTAVDFQLDENGSPIGGHGATSLPVSIKIIVKEPKCFGVLATIVGTGDPDTIAGTSGNDVIFGAGGDDDIRGAGGDDLICGGEGDDILRGGRGNDMIRGNEDNDTIHGGFGDDNLLGGRGEDTASGGEGEDNCVAETTSSCEN